MILTLKQKSYGGKEKIPLEYKTISMILCDKKKISLNFKIDKKETLDCKSEYTTLYLSDFGLFDLKKIANR